MLRTIQWPGQSAQLEYPALKGSIKGIGMPCLNEDPNAHASKLFPFNMNMSLSWVKLIKKRKKNTYRSNYRCSVSNT